MAESQTATQADIDAITEAIQRLDDWEWHTPNGPAMKAQAALTRLRERLEALGESL